MDAPFTGGCACGALRYAMTVRPAAQFQCQCRDCQGLGGGGHSSWLIFGDPAESCVTGPAARWSSYSAGGVEKRHGFCPTCGSPVFLTFPDSTGKTAVIAASLDDPSRFQPGFVTWGSTGTAWDRLDPALTVFDKMPPAR